MCGPSLLHETTIYCLFGRYSSSLTPVISSKPPNSFRSRPVSISWLRKVNMPDTMLPAMIAGSTFLISSRPCFHRNRQAINAEGIKNSKLMARASDCSIPATNPSHKISKLPPPVPNPERMPSTVPTATATGKLVTIDIVPRPIKSRFPAHGAATPWGSFFRRSLPKCPLMRCRSGREWQHARGWPDLLRK